MSNPFTEINSIKNISSLFLPSIAVGLTSEDANTLKKKGLDIFLDSEKGGKVTTGTDSAISLEKLAKFIKPSVVMRHRFTDH